MEYNENGIWTPLAADSYHEDSPKLAKWLANYLPKTTLIDFGCGTGYYCAELQKAGINCFGVDGNAESIECANYVQHDLTVGIKLNEVDTVLSLEVGEHLPKSAEETFMQTLTSHAKKNLILSWAEIGQPGVGHVNCRSQQDVIEDVESRGFKLNNEATQDARNNIDDNCDWFRRTLLVFTK
jgi:tryptophanyl-tRNA synthetase